MTIRYHIGQDGSFTAGDVDSGVTAYAYPSSEHAAEAKRNPLEVAEEMIQGEMSWSRMSHLAAAYDRRNWERMAR